MYPIRELWLVWFLLLFIFITSGCNGKDNKKNPVTSNPVPSGVGLVDCGATGNVGSLQVTLLAPNQVTTVPAAKVNINHSTSGQTICSGNTAADGRIEFQKLSAGIYHIASKAGIFEQSLNDITVSAGVTTQQNLALPKDSKKLAVVTGSYDSIEVVLENLGFSYTVVDASSLIDTTIVNQYDFLFLNCGLDETYANDTSASVLSNFVSSGKQLYLSDWAYIYLQRAFPGKINFYGDDAIDQAAQVGQSGAVTANVIDKNFITALGKNTMEINFDLPGWVVVDAVNTGVSTLITADVTISDLTTGGDITLTGRPLVTVFNHGSGKVTYTSFHNEAQPTQDMSRALETMLFQ